MWVLKASKQARQALGVFREAERRPPYGHGAVRM